MGLDKLRQIDRSPEEQIDKTLYELTETLLKASILDDNLKGKIKAFWERLVKQVNPDGKNQDAQDMTWQLFEAILYGDIDMYKIGNNNSSYICECPSMVVIAERYDSKIRDQIRIWVHKEGFTGTTRRRPHLVNIITNNPQLKKNKRLQQIFLLIVGEHRKNRKADTTRRLAGDAEMLALAEEDNVEVYFEIITDFFNYLSTEVFAASPHEFAKEIAAFFRFMSKKYLPVVHQYCKQLREIKGSQPHIEKLLLEALLDRNGKQIKTPKATVLFKRWEDVQIYLENFAQYKNRRTFSFVNTLNLKTDEQQVATSNKAAAVVREKTDAKPKTPSTKGTILGLGAIQNPETTTPSVVATPTRQSGNEESAKSRQTILGIQAVDPVNADARRS